MKSYPLKSVITAIIFLFSNSVFAAPNLTIDLASTGGPEMDIKRGLVVEANGFSSDEKKKIDLTADLGLNIVTLAQNFIADDIGFELASREFYIDINGRLQSQVAADVVRIRRYADEKGLEVIYQVSGTPYCGIFNGHAYSHGLVPVETDREWSGKANWYPVPVGNYRRELGTKIAEWAEKVEMQDGPMKSIWVGTQEPTHTLGFPRNRRGGPKKNKPEQNENVQLYLETWKNTANDLSKAGYKVGALQLNGSNVSLIDFTVASLKAENVHFDYFTVQQYSAEHTNTTIFSTVKRALISNGYDWKKRLLLNRYSIKEPHWEMSASGIVDWLGAEKLVVDNADLIYGYAHEYSKVVRSQMFANTLKFVQNMIKVRRQLTSSPDINGFAGSDQSRYTAVIWNESNSDQAVEMRLTNMPTVYKNKKLTVEIGAGSRLSFVSAKFDTLSGEIKNFVLPERSYALIEIK